MLAGRVGDLARGGDDAGQRPLALITWPRPAGTICSSAAIVPLIVPTALIESIAARVASSCSQASPVRRTPALLTQRSRLPCSATIAAARARQAASSRTSSNVD
jgi:hypothetical protein